MMSPRRSLKLKRKKHQKIFFATQNRIINIRIRIKTFEMPIFLLCEMDSAIQTVDF